MGDIDADGKKKKKEWRERKKRIGKKQRKSQETEVAFPLLEIDMLVVNSLRQRVFLNYYCCCHWQWTWPLFADIFPCQIFPTFATTPRLLKIWFLCITNQTKIQFQIHLCVTSWESNNHLSIKIVLFSINSAKAVSTSAMLPTG